MRSDFQFELGNVGHVIHPQSPSEVSISKATAADHIGLAETTGVCPIKANAISL